MNYFIKHFRLLFDQRADELDILAQVGPLFVQEYLLGVLEFRQPEINGKLHCDFAPIFWKNFVVIVIIDVIIRLRGICWNCPRFAVNLINFLAKIIIDIIIIFSKGSHLNIARNLADWWVRCCLSNVQYTLVLFLSFKSVGIICQPRTFHIIHYVHV